MSYQSGYQTLTQSMNGFLSFNDGAGTIIQDGSITANSFLTNNLLAEYANQACSLFSNIITATIQIGSATVTSVINIGRYITISDKAIDSSVEINIGSATSIGVKFRKGRWICSCYGNPYIKL